jgi:hypothetical protein
VTEHVSEFKSLLENTVNLDKTRLDSLDTSTDALFSALKNDDAIGDLVVEKIKQGSWAHRTIIKPKKGTGFDADFLLKMVEQPDWNDTPARYGDAVYDALTDDGRYARQPRDCKDRCVRVVYADGYHVDIVPFVVTADGNGWIIDSSVNGGAGKWEAADPTGYTTWMKGKDDLADGNLRETVRLLKYLRDHQDKYADTKSVILTTVVGNQVTALNKAINPGCYANVPTTLLTVTGSVADWLDAHEAPPPIEDRSAPGADLGHRWTPESYAQLRDDMREVADLVRAAYAANVSDSRTLWHDLFGTGFDAPASSSAAAAGGAGAAGLFGTTSDKGSSGRAG